MNSRSMNTLHRLVITGALSVVVPASVARAEVPKPEQLILGVGVNQVFDPHEAAFGSIELRFTPLAAELRPWIYGSLSTEGGVFTGLGLAYTYAFGESRWSASAGIGPGYYHDGDDVFLGGDFEILSFIEVAYRLHNDATIGARFAHLSNAGVRNVNPGTEMVSLQYSIPLGGR